ncbi:twin-arginine translocase TatA/TatE family subunit [Desulfuromonas acetoxidans]|nr:twin-arginine translocase TatA/TatE family subunit [Desulfuromonas acetoxidans]MBF0645442.1 twin-arginine translocase TatA/TatE family subunit [Desulfuromonas acetoxidans]NVD25357.1 twin-arginine translocase TatA/TatE family subunit [Desulfuromonas acetoxidans]NVE17409.1 twin-arginine translocase TatA/TatE family subunit [Desulfuromonas acetoxidans]
MFGIGLPELMMILILALVVMGPKKMPAIAKALGRGLNEFRHATQEIKNSIEIDMSDHDQDKRS